MKWDEENWSDCVEMVAVMVGEGLGELNEEVRKKKKEEVEVEDALLLVSAAFREIKEAVLGQMDKMQQQQQQQQAGDDGGGRQAVADDVGDTHQQHNPPLLNMMTAKWEIAWRRAKEESARRRRQEMAAILPIFHTKVFALFSHLFTLRPSTTLSSPPASGLPPPPATALPEVRGVSATAAAAAVRSTKLNKCDSPTTAAAAAAAAGGRRAIQNVRIGWNGVKTAALGRLKIAAAAAAGDDDECNVDAFDQNVKNGLQTEAMTQRNGGGATHRNAMLSDRTESVGCFPFLSFEAREWDSP
uniref:Uncharacterized protein n=1 Tax=Globodera rostochiensis TaxID=31243 RepID=A0A914HT18_GLORO